MLLYMSHYEELSSLERLQFARRKPDRDRDGSILVVVLEFDEDIKRFLATWLDIF